MQVLNPARFGRERYDRAPHASSSLQREEAFLLPPPPLRKIPTRGRDSRPRPRRIPHVPSDIVRGLKCRLCGKAYPAEPLNFCTDDFGPLEVDYDYAAIAEGLSRAKIEL